MILYPPYRTGEAISHFIKGSLYTAHFVAYATLYKITIPFAFCSVRDALLKKKSKSVKKGAADDDSGIEEEDEAEDDEEEDDEEDVETYSKLRIQVNRILRWIEGIFGTETPEKWTHWLTNQMNIYN